MQKIANNSNGPAKIPDILGLKSSARKLVVFAEKVHYYSNNFLLLPYYEIY